MSGCADAWRPYLQWTTKLCIRPVRMDASHHAAHPGAHPKDKRDDLLHSPQDTDRSIEHQAHAACVCGAPVIKQDAHFTHHSSLIGAGGLTVKRTTHRPLNARLPHRRTQAVHELRWRRHQIRARPRSWRPGSRLGTLAVFNALAARAPQRSPSGSTMVLPARPTAARRICPNPAHRPAARRRHRSRSRRCCPPLAGTVDCER